MTSAKNIAAGWKRNKGIGSERFVVGLAQRVWADLGRAGAFQGVSAM